MSQPVDGKPKPKASMAAANIETLNEIDKDIARMLAAGAGAFKALGLDSGDGDSETQSSQAQIEAAKAAFTTSTSEYFTHLSSIHSRLKAQIQALESAKIIAGREAATDATEKNKSALVGSVDTGSLRTRIDTVEKDMEREIWTRAAKLAASTREELDEKMDTD